MIKWFRRNQEDAAPVQAEEPQEIAVIEPTPVAKVSFYERFKQGLSKTRQQLGNSVGRLLLGKKVIDKAILEELETLLLQADIGINTAQVILKELSNQLDRQELANGEAVFNALQKQLQSILDRNIAPLSVDNSIKKPFVILMVGVNGAGKTTTIGKLAQHFKQQNKKVMLAAGDTFRAAAIEQLQAWGQRNEVQVIAQQPGSDSASVSYDALQAAISRGMDVLIIDTAGRLHTQSDLMNELKKVKRVLQKLEADTPHETMLVLDASIGQNALVQAREFHQAIGLTGITMTKLDGTAKGGILFAIANELALPFRYIGVGEGIEDLRPFNAEQFVKAIFND